MPKDKFQLPNTKTITGVKVFRVGTWNGIKFTKTDLAQIVASFHATKTAVKPFLKLGHNDGQEVLERDDLPAAGWVSDLRLEGDSLVADFQGIPAKVFDLIERGAFRGRSIEIWRDFKVAGVTHKWFLTAVALLGSEVPAVDTLQDMVDLFAAQRGEVLKFGADGEPMRFRLEDHTPAKERNNMEKELKVFTLEEANQLLPLLEQLIEELQQKQEEAGQLEVEVDATELITDSSEQRSSKGLSQLTERHQQLVNEFYEIVDKIHSHRCFLKDVDLGLVDFYGNVDGRVVYYCWRLGEERIGFWHEVGQGYATRQPL